MARLLRICEPLRTRELRLTEPDKLSLARNPLGSVRALLDECAEAVALATLQAAGGAPLTREEFNGVREHFRAHQSVEVRSLLLALVPILHTWWEISQRLQTLPNPSVALAWDDMRAQLDDLLSPGALVHIGPSGIPDLQRYLRAVQRRIEALPQDAARDLLRMEQVHHLEARFAELPVEARRTEAGNEIRRDLEEFRVNLWAQDLRGPTRVSEQRILKAINGLS